MNGEKRELIVLKEYQRETLSRARLSDAEGQLLWQRYGRYIHVDFPSFKTGEAWELTSLGWVGYISLTGNLVVELKPKVALGNLFGMLEYAYQLKSFEFLSRLVQTEKLSDFYENLADILAKRILERARKGFYRAYQECSDTLPYLTGRLNTRKLLRPWETRLDCEYQEHSADVEENRLLLWTLYCILRSGLCDRTLPTLRRTYHTLANFATLAPFTSQDCVGRLYNRLNDDYRSLHALCRFFLEHSGPGHQTGDHTFLPFLIDMARLYELFVAEWLKRHLPEEVQMRAQDRIVLGAEQCLHFNIDLTLYDVVTGAAVCVLDTKYKAPDHPSREDINQIVTYATLQHCSQAVLVYPMSVPLDVRVGEIHVCSLTFSLKENLEAAGEEFLKQLLALKLRSE